MIKNIPLDQIPKIFNKPTLTFIDRPEELTRKHRITFTDGDTDGLGRASFALFEFEGTPVYLEFLHQNPVLPEGTLHIPTTLMETKGQDFLNKLLNKIPLNITWTSPLIK